MIDWYQIITCEKLVSNPHTCEELIPNPRTCEKLAPNYNRREEFVLNRHRCQWKNCDKCVRFLKNISLPIILSFFNNEFWIISILSYDFGWTRHGSTSCFKMYLALATLRVDINTNEASLLSVTFLAIASPPKPLNAATSNLVGPRITWCRGKWAIFCVTLTPRSNNGIFL